MNSTEDELLAAAHHGNREAFLSLYKRHGGSIFGFLYRLLNSDKMAEDISHECFIDLIRHPEHFKTNHVSLLVQLYRRARDLAVQYLLQIGENTHDHWANRHDMRHDLSDTELVKEAINRLPLLEREALILFEYERLSLDDFASANKAIISSAAYQRSCSSCRCLNPNASPGALWLGPCTLLTERSGGHCLNHHRRTGYPMKVKQLD